MLTIVVISVLKFSNYLSILVCYFRYPPIPPRLIYTHIAIFLAVGFLMSSRLKRKELSLVYAGQLLYFAYNTYSNQSLRYTEPQRVSNTYMYMYMKVTIKKKMIFSPPTENKYKCTHCIYCTFVHYSVFTQMYSCNMYKCK